MTLSVFKIKQGARAETLFYEVGYSLVGYTDPRFSMRNRQTGAVIQDNAVAVICDGTYIINDVSRVLTPADGIVYYAWGLTDLDTTGNYDAEFRFTATSGQYVFEPTGNEYITILIGDAIGGTASLPLPSGVVLASPANNAARVTFTGATGAVSHEIAIGLESAGTFPTSTTGTSPIDFTGVAPGTYRARVRAVFAGLVYGAWVLSGTVAVAGTVLPDVASLSGFGDSITVGSNASPLSNSWMTLVATDLGAGTPLNQGISGTVLQNSNDSGGSPRASNGRDRFAAALLGGNKREMVIVAYGYNDARYTAAPGTFNVAQYKNDLQEAMNGLRIGGFPADRIVIVAPYYITDTGLATGSAGFTGQTRGGFEAFVTAAAEVAAEFGTWYFDAYAYMLANGAGTLIDTDNIHPTNTGHATIAAGLLQTSAIANALAVPTVIGIASAGANAADVTFTAAAGAVSYEAEIGIEGGYTFPIALAGSASPIAFTGVAAGTYRARVRAAFAGAVKGPWVYSSAATVFLNDTFTVANGTLLTARTPEAGATWVRQLTSIASNYVAEGNGMYSDGNPGVFVNNVTAPSGDYIVEATMNVKSIVTHENIGIIGRAVIDVVTYYCVRWQQSVAGWQLLKLVGGTATVLGTYTNTPTAGADVTIGLSMQGSTIKMFVAGVERASVTDTGISAAGFAGVRNGGAVQTASTGIHTMDIKATAL